MYLQDNIELVAPDVGTSCKIYFFLLKIWLQFCFAIYHIWLGKFFEQNKK